MPKAVPLVASALLLAGGWGLWRAQTADPASTGEIALLVPDGTDLRDPRITLWLDAAAEEGIRVTPVEDSRFLRAEMAGRRFPAVILPDTIHRSATDVLIGGITQAVEEGASLMLVGDAAVLDQHDMYPHGASRLSRLAGVDYALYDELREHTTAWGQLSGSPRVLDELGIPPGAAIPSGDEATFVRYGDGELLYPSLTTRGSYDGRLLLHSPVGVAAGARKFGRGSVLYVNLELGYLAGQTDGLLLHAFLRYFAEHLLALPTLCAVPDGVGGLVLNWHLDSNAALEPLRQMREAGILDQGPYSIHVTAGPDAREPGDGLGLDVPGNPAIQQRIRELAGRGHAIGSHGGWIHDYFGLRASEDNQGEFEKLLVLNNQALEAIAGGVREYSAPVGNQPRWVTAWLQQHGIRAYYFTGNAGMAPTQTYRDGSKSDVEGWSFPIAHLGHLASFEEMHAEEIPEAEVLGWLEALTDFCARRRTARLFYSHPPGAVRYLGVLRRWLAHTADLRRDGTFRWYTMSELADFLTRRKDVAWRIRSSAEGRQVLLAEAHGGLGHMTWLLPASVYARPIVVEGTAAVDGGPEAWRVVAQSGTRLQVELPMARAGETRP
jgi:hypothetical protein